MVDITHLGEEKLGQNLIRSYTDTAISVTLLQIKLMVFYCTQSYFTIPSVNWLNFLQSNSCGCCPVNFPRFFNILWPVRITLLLREINRKLKGGSNSCCSPQWCIFDCFQFLSYLNCGSACKRSVKEASGTQWDRLNKKKNESIQLPQFLKNSIIEWFDS